MTGPSFGALELVAVVRKLTGTAADLVFLDLGRRLAKLLLAEATVGADGTRVCELPMSQSGIAAQLGVTRQSLNRALGGLVRRGWLAVEGSRVVLVEPSALEQFARS